MVLVPPCVPALPTKPSRSEWKPGILFALGRQLSLSCWGHLLLCQPSPSSQPSPSLHPMHTDLWKIDILFVVGGRGGQAAAESIHRECRSKTVGAGWSSWLAADKTMARWQFKATGWSTGIERSVGLRLHLLCTEWVAVELMCTTQRHQADMAIPCTHAGALLCGGGAQVH